MDKNIIGIDVGASKIACGLISPTGQILSDVKIATDAKKGADRVIKNIVLAIEEISPKKEQRRIGIGMAGQIDIAKGTVVHSPNMKVLDGQPIVELLSKELGKEYNIKIDNDSNCFALAENRIGVGQGTKNMVGLTIGTGIGSGLIIDGKLYHGEGYAAEIGHMKLENFGPKCNCGSKGCLEAFSSGRAIEKRFEEFTTHQKTATDIEEEALREGKGDAMKVYQEAGKYLGLALANIIDILDPAMIVFGGGVGKSEILHKYAIAEMKKRVFLKNFHTKVTRSNLGDKTGMIGAALLFS